MHHLLPAMLIIIGIIHLLPLSGVAGDEQLRRLYGLPFAEPNLAMLMCHCAVLFGMRGVFFIYAAFRSAKQPVALIAGFVSVVSFLRLAWSTGGYNTQISRVVATDLVALVCLLVAAGVWLYGAFRSQ